MIFKKYYIIFLFCFLPFLLTFEAVAEKILWPYFHYPPLFNVEEGKLSGYGIHVQKIISSQMPEYSHKMILAQPARLFEDLKNGEKYIAYGPVKTQERQKYLYFSLPCRLVFTDSVAMNRDKAKKYLIDSKISLKKLLADKSLVMGHSKGASYGTKIDSILKENANTLRQEIITGEESEIRQLKMIQIGRIDWMIWDPLTLEILFKREDLQGGFGIYEVYEKEDTFVYAHIVAPKNEWGKKIIKKINTILKNVVSTNEFYEGLSEWIPEGLKSSFRKGYEEFIIKPAIEYEAEDK